MSQPASPVFDLRPLLWANAAARAAAVPAYTGQRGIEIDTGTEWRGSGTTAGAWTQIGGAGNQPYGVPLLDANGNLSNAIVVALTGTYASLKAINPVYGSFGYPSDSSKKNTVVFYDGSTLGGNDIVGLTASQQSPTTELKTALTNAGVFSVATSSYLPSGCDLILGASSSATQSFGLTLGGMAHVGDSAVWLSTTNGAVALNNGDTFTIHGDTPGTVYTVTGGPYVVGTSFVSVGISPTLTTAFTSTAGMSQPSGISTPTLVVPAGIIVTSQAAITNVETAASNSNHATSVSLRTTSGTAALMCGDVITFSTQLSQQYTVQAGYSLTTTPQSVSISPKLAEAINGSSTPITVSVARGGFTPAVPRQSFLNASRLEVGTYAPVQGFTSYVPPMYEVAGYSANGFIPGSLWNDALNATIPAAGSNGISYTNALANIGLKPSVAAPNNTVNEIRETLAATDGTLMRMCRFVTTTAGSAWTINYDYDPNTFSPSNDNAFGGTWSAAGSHNQVVNFNVAGNPFLSAQTQFTGGGAAAAALGFFGATPVQKQTIRTGTAGSSYTSNEQNLLNDVITLLRRLFNT